MSNSERRLVEEVTAEKAAIAAAPPVKRILADGTSTTAPRLVPATARLFEKASLLANGSQQQIAHVGIAQLAPDGHPIGVWVEVSGNAAEGTGKRRVRRCWIPEAACSHIELKGEE